MAQSNVVRISFPNALAGERPAPAEEHAPAEVITLAVANAFAGAESAVDSGARDEIAWALEIAAQDRRLSFAVVDARKRLNRLVRETCPKPEFTPTGEGYEDVSLALAQTILADRHPFFGSAEMDLLAAVEAFDAAERNRDAVRAQLSVTSGLDALVGRREALRAHAAEAYEILRVHGIDPAHV